MAVSVTQKLKKQARPRGRWPAREMIKYCTGSHAKSRVGNGMVALETATKEEVDAAAGRHAQRRLITGFVALQDVTEAMGPTQIVPRSATGQVHEQLKPECCVRHPGRIACPAGLYRTGGQLWPSPACCPARGKRARRVVSTTLHNIRLRGIFPEHH